MPRTLPIALFALLAGYSGTAPAAGTGPFKPMDLFGLQWADAPAVSPDGRSVVFTGETGGQTENDDEHDRPHAGRDSLHQIGRQISKHA